MTVQIIISHDNTSFSSPPFQIALAAPLITDKWGTKFKKGTAFQVTSRRDSCRTYLSNYLYEAKYGSPLEGLDYPLSAPLDTKNSYLYVLVREPKISRHELFRLNTMCTEAGISKVRIFSGDNLGEYIIRGDKAWQTCNWKMTIFSYMVKKIFLHTTEYDEELNVHWDSWVKNLKDNNVEEFIHDGIDVKTYEFNGDEDCDEPDLFSIVHEYSGFVSIASTRNNPTMRMVLLGEEYHG